MLHEALLASGMLTLVALMLGILEIPAFKSHKAESIPSMASERQREKKDAEASEIRQLRRRFRSRLC